MSTQPLAGRDPAWLQEVDAALCVSSHFVVGGNTNDLVISHDPPGSSSIKSGVVDALWHRLQATGVEFILSYDITAGVRIHPIPDPGGATERVVSDLLSGIDRREVSLERLPTLIDRVAGAREHRCALTIERAGRLVLRPDALTPAEHAFFCAAALAARSAPRHRAPARGPLDVFNPVIWIVENERELPDWFLNTGERLRMAVVPSPYFDDRAQMARWLAPVFTDFDDLDEAERETAIERFAGQTHGMRLTDMESIKQLAKDQDLGLSEIEDAIRAYRLGILENPWRQASLREHVRRELAALELTFENRDEQTITPRRVIGQDNAVRRSLDILARSVTNLTGAHRPAQAVGPRGVLFFAGPTGVGKTELAKALTEVVFGDIAAYTRFDMSEFADSSSAARLIGAPPGYIGFDAGGELTNAVRERPFSLLLFDEIEKADDLVFDKFLQILEDGRLTDGRGGTVVFSESILVFTSNLGISRELEGGKREMLVTRDTPRVEAEASVSAAIRDRFRPEFVNRLGGNIIVFDYVERAVAQHILDLLLANVGRRIEREYGAKLVLEPAALATLTEVALSDAALENGGRGIGSEVERALVNPLAHRMILYSPPSGGEVRVVGVRQAGGVFEVECS